MRFSYNFLQSFFEKKLPPAEKLAELLMMHFFEVEDVEKNDNDVVLDIDILSSRAGDCLSHIGVAREIAAITGMKIKNDEIKFKENGENINDKIRVDVKAACSRYTLKEVTDVKIGDSPQYIQKILKACGINPINNVVDIANYVMIETGQPLHVFDSDKLEGDKIFVRYAKKREKIVTLDEKRHELQENILVISDEVSAVGIAGIKGGIVAEVDKNTKNIYIEAANFDPVTIRRGAHTLKIRTDASLRFEHGISAELTEIAINKASLMISDIAKGNVTRGVVDYYPEKEKERNIIFNISDVRKVLGEDISLKETERILKSLSFKVQRNKGSFSANVPYFRTDVFIKEDVIEEIGRIYGYDQIEAKEPIDSIIPKEQSKGFLVVNIVRDIWQSFGFYETYNYSFINEETSLKFEKKNLIEMEKPVSLEFKYLRPSLIPGLLKNLSENRKNYEKINLFEIGSIFYKSEEGTKEERVLSLISSSEDFYQLKGKINLFLGKMSLSNISYHQKGKKELFHDKKTGEIFFEKERIGFLGEVSEEIKKEMKIKENILIAEINLEKIIEMYKEIKNYEPILKFPPSVRDLAVLIPDKTPYKDVFEKIKREGGSLLKEVSLFDFYKGKEVPEGMKSFAFRLIFQAKNKTLSSEEVSVVFEKIINALEEFSEYKVRK
jgi:phenylalanyl-tRNA synthetase beta chain